MTIKQAVKENKMISVILGVLAGGLLTWGVWVTDGVYKVKYGKDMIDAKREITSLKQDAEMKVICSDIFELKKTDVYIIAELKDLREISHRNYQEILKILLNIQKRIKE